MIRIFQLRNAFAQTHTTQCCVNLLEIILVEGLKLKDIEAGIYDVHCLPLRLYGAEGCPIRCVLIK
ncbi:putative kynurenine formamidase superfamily [Helianthus annuus]|nr:putative kynurenine formamidase superfamily [Helianthus annuus]